MTIRKRAIAVIEKVNSITIEDDGTPIDLYHDLGLDSLDKIETAMFIEDEFKIAFTDDEENGARTISDFVALIDRKLS
jgi:acyl carrier protein